MAGDPRETEIDTADTRRTLGFGAVRSIESVVPAPSSTMKGTRALVDTPVVTVVGWHDAGKTLLVELLVAELKRRGVRMAVIKHTRGRFDVDREGTDTWRFARAGSDVVGIVGPQGLALIERTERELALADVLGRLPSDLDLVIVEGYKSLPLPKIVVRGDEGETPIEGPGEILLVLHAARSAAGGVSFAEAGKCPPHRARLSRGTNRRGRRPAGRPGSRAPCPWAEPGAKGRPTGRRSAGRGG